MIIGISKDEGYSWRNKVISVTFYVCKTLIVINLHFCLVTFFTTM